ncbi:MAG: polysaccharide biosynthesis transport protein [Chthoniobacter sp.]|jgi:capsular exopolysaccharide synthesis family protein|nr:polysaccharide biosynthesis transport protein [Chthoniobacter sp.]
MKKPPAPAASLDGIDFHEIAYVLLEKAWLIVICVIIGGVLGGAYISRSPRIFGSREVIQVEQQAQKVINIQEVNPQETQSSELVRTIEQNLVSLSLLDRVAKENNLSGDGASLAGKVTAKIRPGTRLIDIVAEDQKPGLAQTIAHSVVREFIRQSVEQRTGSTEVASEFLIQEGQRLKAHLEKSEQALQSYKEQTQAVSLEERQNITVAKLKDLNQRVTEAKTERLRLESDFGDVEKFRGDNERLNAIASVAANPGLINFRSNLGSLEAGVAALSERYRAKNPKLIQARSQLENMRARLPMEIARAAASVVTIFEASKSTEQKFDQALREQELAALNLAKLSIPYNVLMREVESDRALYESVLKRMKETDVTRGLEQNNVRIIETAGLPKAPVRPDKVRIMLLAFAGGLAAGLGLSFGLNAIDSSFKTVDKTEKILGVPILGAVPRNAGDTAMVFDDATSAAAEAFRSLRTCLSLLGKVEQRKVTLFTSAVPAEGKSFCAINHAISLAHQGLRTLLIDADLRRPSIAPALLGAETTLGLTDLLTGQAAFGQAIHPAKEEHLFVLPAGSRAPNPAELLSRSDFGALIAESAKQFDRIVIDTAPVNAVSDTLLLVEHAHSVCLVVRAGSTSRKAVLRASAALTSAGHGPVGAILNWVTSRNGVGYYYHYSAGRYGKADALVAPGAA